MIITLIKDAKLFFRGGKKSLRIVELVNREMLGKGGEYSQQILRKKQFTHGVCGNEAGYRLQNYGVSTFL